MAINFTVCTLLLAEEMALSPTFTRIRSSFVLMFVNGYFMMRSAANSEFRVSYPSFRCKETPFVKLLKNLSC